MDRICLRSDQIRPQRMVLEGNYGGLRFSGRPRIMWLQDVLSDLVDQTYRLQRRKPEERSAWKKICEQTKALKRLRRRYRYCQLGLFTEATSHIAATGPCVQLTPFKQLNPVFKELNPGLRWQCSITLLLSTPSLLQTIIILKK